MYKPLISIFLPYYNDEEFIAEAIKSILQQTYQNFELILFNHASTDSSREIARSFLDDRIVHIDSDINYNAGCGLNFWNTLPKMKGEYVKIFCADDIMLSTHLEELLTYLLENSEKDFVITNKADYIDQNGKLTGDSFDKFEKYGVTVENFELELLALYFRSFSILPWGGALFKKTVFDGLQKDNSFIYLFDVSVWVQLLLAGKKAGLIDKSLYLYRTHSGAMMSQNFSKVSTICYFEHLAYNEIFYKTKNIDVVKFLCSEIKGIEQLDEKNIDLIPYFIARKAFEMPVEAYNYPEYMGLIYKNNAYINLYKMLQDDRLRETLSQELGFTIKDFRELYSSTYDVLRSYMVTAASHAIKYTLLELLFSVKNYSQKHKVLTVLGIKFKFRRRKK